MGITQNLMVGLSWLVAYQQYYTMIPMMLLLPVVRGETLGGEANGRGRVEVESRQDFTLSSCADIPSETTEVSGTVWVTGDIDCDTRKTLIVADGHEALFASEGVERFKNVCFRVGNTGSAQFVGSAQVFERDETMREPIFEISGTVKVQALGWIPQHMGGGEEDVGDLVKHLTGGTNTDIITETSTARYTPNRMVVAKKVARKELPTQKAAVPMPHTSHKVFDPSPVTMFDGRMENKGDASNDGSSSVEGTLEAVGTAEAATASAAPTISDDGITSINIAVATAANGANNAIPRSNHWTNKHHGGHRATYFTPFVTKVIGDGPPSIKVGDELVWPSSLTNAETNTRLTLAVDGSILESRIANSPASGVDSSGGVGASKVGSGGGSGEEAGVVVARADPRKVVAVMTKRFVQRSKSLMIRLSGGKLEEETAVMKVTNKGAVEVFLDGAKVLSKSGPHTKEWKNKFRVPRKKSQDYALHVVEGGFEVRCDGKRIWGVVSPRAV